jgi:glutamine amidotransferase
MVTLVDYGLGNVKAFVNTYTQLDIPVRVARTAEELSTAERIILPGVGSFDWAMERLDASGMRSCLDDLVLSAGRPVLGVCVGMQMMAHGSEEGTRPGLGWTSGQVRRFRQESAGPGVHLPHMGWNDVAPAREDALFRGVYAPRFYFLHSYHFALVAEEEVVANTEYGGVFACAIRRQNICGVQFHPEKSHQWGAQLLRNFATL